MSEGLWKLPKDWMWVELEEIADVYGGGTPSREQPAFFDGDVVWITPSDLTNELPVPTVSESATKLTSDGLASSSARLVPKGTVLFSSRASIGKIAIAAAPLATNQGFANFVCRDGLDNRYLAYVLRKFTPEIERLGGSTTYREVSKSALKRFRIPFPPWQEQQRIVAEIDALFDRVREAKRLRTQAQEDGVVLFSSVLEELLEETYFAAPPIVPLGEFGSAFNGRASGSGESDVRVFKTKHVYPFDLKQKQPSFMKPDQISKCPPNRYLRQWDVLVCNIARGTLGRLCHVEHAEVNWTVDTQIMILRTNARCLGKWLYYYLYSRRGQKEIFAREKGIAFADKRGQTHLYPRDVLTIPVPLPSVADQTEYISFLDRVHEHADALKTSINDTNCEIRRLEESILDHAFRGQL
jgi:type I restriction enzyme, S subunit